MAQVAFICVTHLTLSAETMRPVDYGTPTLTSIAENFPGISVSDATKTAFSGFEAPDGYNVLNPWRNETHTHQHASQALGLTTPIIRQSITGQITRRVELSWYVGVVMPMVQISTNSFKTNTLRFEETMAPPTPAEGIPTITETKMDEQTHTITRRAKAFKMEHEYMKTDIGKQTYIRNLAHMSTITFEVMCYDVIHALINAKNVSMEWELKYGNYTTKTEEEILSREKEFWCALQKQEFGFQKLDTRVSQIHGRYGINDLDTYILPMEPKDWLAVTPAENTDYNKGGQQAVDNITTNIGNAIDGKKPLGKLLGRYDVFMTRTYCTSANGQQENPMIRERHIGEFNRMLPIQEESGAEYKSSHRTIKVYDEDDDRARDITLRECLEASDMLFTDDGILQTKHHHPENYEEGMKHNFLFKRDSHDSTGFSPIDYFGEMEEKDLSTRTIMEFGKSCVAALSRETKHSYDALIGIVEDAENNNTLQQTPSKVEDVKTMGELAADVKNIQLNEIKVNPATKRRDITLTSNRPPNATIMNALTTSLPSSKKATKAYSVVSSLHNKFSKIMKGNPVLTSNEDNTAGWLESLLPGRVGFSEVQYPVWVKILPKDGAGDADVFNTLLVGLAGLILYDFGNPKSEEVLKRARTVLSGNLTKLKRGEVIGKIKETFRKNGSVDDALNVSDDQMTSVVGFVDEMLRDTSIDLDNPPGDLKDLPVFRDYKTNASNSVTLRCPYIDRSKAAMRDVIETLLGISSEELDKFALSRTVMESKGNVESLLEKLVKKDRLDAYGFKILLEEVREASVGNEWREINNAPKAAKLIAGKVVKQIKIGTKEGLRHILTQYRIPHSKLGAFVRYTATHLDENTVDYPQLDVTISKTENSDPLDWPQLVKFYKSIPEHDLSDLHVTVKSNKLWGLNVVGEAKDYEDEVKRALGGGRTSQRKPRVKPTSDDEGDGNITISTSNMLGDSDVEDTIDDTPQDQDEPPYRQPIKYKHRTRASPSRTGPVDILRSIGKDTSRSFHEHINKIKDSTEPTLCKIFAYLLLFTNVNKITLSNFIDNDLIFPIGFLIFRPHQRYNMAMALKVKAGTEMGATYHNPLLRDYQEEDTAMTKTRFGHWSWHSKAIVTDPSRVFPVYDIFCQQTLGGAGTQFFTGDDIETYRPDEFQFSGKDIFAIAVPYEYYKTKMANCIDASGSWSHYQIGYSNFTKKDKAPHYPTAAYYNAFWGWRKAYERGSQPIEDGHHPMGTGQYVTALMPKNTTMWLGSTWHWNNKSNKFMLVFGKGHFGAHAYPGSLAQRNGQFQKWIIPEPLIQQTV